MKSSGKARSGAVVAGLLTNDLCQGAGCRSMNSCLKEMLGCDILGSWLIMVHLNFLRRDFCIFVDTRTVI